MLENNIKIPLLITGANGLVGSKFVTDFSHLYDFENLDRLDPKEPVDILDLEAVINKFTHSQSQFVVHLAAFTDVNKAWEERGDQNGAAYQVNVIGTKNMIEACYQTGKHLIHISTAFVFVGEKEDVYAEDDSPHAIEWYGQTKLIAENLVRESKIDWTILRIDFPFRSDNFVKPDIARKTIAGIKQKRAFFVDHFFGPTYIDDLVKIFDLVIRKRLTGLYHASSGEKWSDYDFASLIKEKFNLDEEIRKGNLTDYLKILNRPYQKNTALNCDKLKSELDFEMKSIEEAVGELIH